MTFGPCTQVTSRCAVSNISNPVYKQRGRWSLHEKSWCACVNGPRSNIHKCTVFPRVKRSFPASMYMRSKTRFTIANLPREIISEIYLRVAENTSESVFGVLTAPCLIRWWCLLRLARSCAILQFCDFSQRINSLFIPKLWRIKSDQFTTSEISEIAPIN